MLRAVLLGVGLGVLSWSMVGCKADPETITVAPGAAAGKVIELGGAVTSYGSGEGRTASRPLHVGDLIAREETIETGSDGRISIELAHNLVRVDLPPNSHKKLTETLGWNAPRRNENAKPTDQDTSAAGRPVERAAADTADTAKTVKKEEAASAPEAAAPATGGAPAAPRAEVSPPPPPPREMLKKSAPSGSVTAKDTTREVPGSAGGGGGQGAADNSDRKPMAPPKVAAPRGMAETARAIPQEEAMAAPDPASEGNALLDKHRAALVACLAHDSAAASFVVHVDESGKVSVDRGRLKVKGSELKCVKRVLKTFAFPHAKLDLALDLKRP